MLATSPNLLRIALNRLSFGIRDAELTQYSTQSTGLRQWLKDQFAAPVGDDPNLAAFLAAQTLRINYAAPAATDTRGLWLATDEMRTLNYLNAPSATLWALATQVGTTFNGAERTRIRQELLAATWIRNIHSRFQLREFMVDFWHNHFNIGKNESELATAMLPLFDSTAIRANAFGNFRKMLEATATSASMLIYLDNWVSAAATPNENYAREIMELHTLGGAWYLGVDHTKVEYGMMFDGVRTGFSDLDVIQASRALSGWTIKNGQRDASNQVLPVTGEFIYNKAMHNTKATEILNFNVSGLTADMAQGRKFLDLIGYNSSTAVSIVTKLCKRIFGDNPPQDVVTRGVNAWMANRFESNQIQLTLEAIVLGGDEIFVAPVTKIRRPYERLAAWARTTDTVVNAAPEMTTALDSLNDGLFAWQAPNGRPDTNEYWLATGAMLTTWNLLFQFPAWASNTTTLTDQTPVTAYNSATLVVEYWVGRMIGYQPAAATMQALVNDQAGTSGVPAASRASTNRAARVETALRRLTALIAATEEFAYR